MLQASPTPRDALIRLESKSLLSVQQHALWDTFLHRHAPAAGGHSAAGDRATASRHRKTTPSAAAHTKAAAHSTTAKAGSTRVQPRHLHGTIGVTGGSAAAAPQHARPLARRQQQQTKEPTRCPRQRDSGQETATDRCSARPTSKGAATAATLVRGRHAVAVHGTGVSASARAVPTPHISLAAGVNTKGGATTETATPNQSHTNGRHVSPAPAVAPLRTPRPAPAVSSAASSATGAPAAVQVEVGKNAASTPLDTATAAAAAAAFAVATTAEDISSPRLFATHLSAWWRQQHDQQGRTPQQQRLQRIQSPREHTIRHNSKLDSYSRYNATCRQSSSSKHSESKGFPLHRPTRVAVNMCGQSSSTDALLPSDAQTAAQWTSGAATEPTQVAAGRVPAGTKARTPAPAGSTAALRLQQSLTPTRWSPVRAKSACLPNAVSTETTATPSLLLQRQQQQLRTGQSDRRRKRLPGSQDRQQQSAQGYWKPPEQPEMRQPQIASLQLQRGQQQQQEGGQQQHLPSRRQQHDVEHQQQTARPYLQELYQQWQQQQLKYQWQDPQGQQQLRATLKEAALPSSKTATADTRGPAAASPPTLSAAATTATRAQSATATRITNGGPQRAEAARDGDGRASGKGVAVHGVESGAGTAGGGRPNACVAAVSSPWMHRSNIPRVDLTVVPSWQKQQQQQRRQQRSHQQLLLQQPSRQQEPGERQENDLLRQTNGLRQQHGQRQQQQCAELQSRPGFTSSSISPRQRAVSEAVAAPAGTAANEPRRTPQQQQVLGQQQFAGVLRRELEQAFSKASQKTVRGMRGELQGLRRDFDTLVEHVKHQQRACTPPAPTAAVPGSFPPTPPSFCRAASSSAADAAAPFAAGAAGMAYSGAAVAPFGCLPGAAAGPFAAPAGAAGFRAAAGAFPFAVPAATTSFGGPAPCFAVPPAASFSAATAATPYPAAVAPFPAASVLPFPSACFPQGFAYPAAVTGPSAAPTSAFTACLGTLRRSRSSSEPRRLPHSWQRQHFDEEADGDQGSITSYTTAGLRCAVSPADTDSAYDWPYKVMHKQQQQLTIQEQRENQQSLRFQAERQQVLKPRRVVAEQQCPPGQQQKQTHLDTRPQHQWQLIPEEEQRQQKYTGFKKSVVTLDLPKRPLVHELERQQIRQQPVLEASGSIRKNRSSSSCKVATRSTAGCSDVAAERSATTILNSLNELSQNLESLARASAAAAAGRSSSHSADLAALLGDATATADSPGTTEPAAAPTPALALGARAAGEATRGPAASGKALALQAISLPTHRHQQQQQHQQQQREGNSLRTASSSLQQLTQPHKLQVQPSRETLQCEERGIQKKQQEQQQDLSDRCGDTAIKGSAGTKTSQQEKTAASVVSRPETGGQEDVCVSAFHDGAQKSNLLEDVRFPFAFGSALPVSCPASTALPPAATSSLHSGQLLAAVPSKPSCREQQSWPLHAVHQEAVHALQQQVMLHGESPRSEGVPPGGLSPGASVPCLRVCAATTQRPTYLRRMAYDPSARAIVSPGAGVSSTHAAVFSSVASGSSLAAFLPPVAANRSPLIPAALFSLDYPPALAGVAFRSHAAAEAAACSPAAAAAFSPSASETVSASFSSATVLQDTAAPFSDCYGGQISQAPYVVVSQKAGEAYTTYKGKGSSYSIMAEVGVPLPESGACAGEAQPPCSVGLPAGARATAAAAQAAAAAREAAAAAASVHGAGAAEAAAAAAKAAVAAKEAAVADAIAAAKATAAAEAAAVAKAAAACAASKGVQGSSGAALATSAGFESRYYIPSSSSTAAATAVRRSHSSSSLLCGRTSSGTSRSSLSLYRSASYRTCAVRDLFACCGSSTANISCNSGINGSNRIMQRLSVESRQQLQPQGLHYEGSRQLRRTSWPTTAAGSSFAATEQASSEEPTSRGVTGTRMCIVNNTNNHHISRSNSSSSSIRSSYNVRSNNTGMQRCRRCEACGVWPTVETGAAGACVSHSHSSGAQSKNKSCGGNSSSSSGSSNAEVGSTRVQIQLAESRTEGSKQHQSAAHQQTYNRSKTSSKQQNGTEEDPPAAAAPTRSAVAELEVANKQPGSGMKAEEAVEAALQPSSTGRIVLAAPAAARPNKRTVVAAASNAPRAAALRAGTATALKEALDVASEADNRPEQETRRMWHEASSRPHTTAAETGTALSAAPTSQAAALAAERKAAAAAEPAALSAVASVVAEAVVAQKARTAAAQAGAPAAAMTPAARRTAISAHTVTKVAAAQTSPRPGAAVSTTPRAAAVQRSSRMTSDIISSEEEFAAACRMVASAAAAALRKERRSSPGHTSRSSTGLSSRSASVCSCCCCYGRHAGRQGVGRCCCSTTNSRSYSETSSIEESCSQSPASWTSSFRYSSADETPSSRRRRLLNRRRRAAATAAQDREQQQQLQDQLQKKFHQQREMQQQQHSELLLLLRDVGASSFSWQLLLQQQVLLQQQLMHQLQQPRKQQTQCSEGCRKPVRTRSCSAASARSGRHKAACPHARAAKKAEVHTTATGEEAVGAAAVALPHINEPSAGVVPAATEAEAHRTAAPEGRSAVSVASAAAACRATSAAERASAAGKVELSSTAGITASEERVSAVTAWKAPAASEDGQMAASAANTQPATGPVVEMVTTTLNHFEASLTFHDGDTAGAASAPSAQGELLQQHNSAVQHRGQQRAGTLHELTTDTSPKRSVPVSLLCSSVVATSEAASSLAKIAESRPSALSKGTHSYSSMPSTCCSSSSAAVYSSIGPAAAVSEEGGNGLESATPEIVTAVAEIPATAANSVLTAAPAAAACNLQNATATALSAATASNGVAATGGGNALVPAPEATAARVGTAGEEVAATSVILCTAKHAHPAVTAGSAESGAAESAATDTVFPTSKKSVDRGSSPIDSYPPCRKTRAVSPITFAAFLHNIGTESNGIQQPQLFRSSAPPATAPRVSPDSILSCISSSDFDAEAVYDTKRSAVQEEVEEKHSAESAATARQTGQLVKQPKALLKRRHHLQLRELKTQRARQREKASTKQKEQNSDTESEPQLAVEQQRQQQPLAVTDALQRRLILLQHQSTASTEGPAEQRELSCAADLLQRTDDSLPMKRHQSSRKSGGGRLRLSKKAEPEMKVCALDGISSMAFVQQQRPQEELQQQPPKESVQQEQQQERRHQQAHLQYQQHMQQAYRDEPGGNQQQVAAQRQQRSFRKLKKKQAQLISLSGVAAAAQTSSSVILRDGGYEPLSSLPGAAAAAGTAYSSRSSIPSCCTADPLGPRPVASYCAVDEPSSATESPTALGDRDSALNSDTEYTDRLVSPTSSSTSKAARRNRLSSRSSGTTSSSSSKHSSSCDPGGRRGRAKITSVVGAASGPAGNSSKDMCCSRNDRGRKQESFDNRQEGEERRNEMTEVSVSNFSREASNSKSRDSRGTKLRSSSTASKKSPLAAVGHSSTTQTTTNDKRRCSIGHNSSTSTITVLKTRDAGPLRLPSLPALLLEGLESQRSVSEQGRNRSDVGGRGSSRDSTDCKRSSCSKLEEHTSQSGTQSSRRLRGRDSISRGTVQGKTDSSSVDEKEDSSKVPTLNRSPGKRALRDRRRSHVVSDSDTGLRTGNSSVRKKTGRSCSKKPSRGSSHQRMQSSGSRHRQRRKARGIEGRHTEDTSSTSRGSAESSGSSSSRLRRQGDRGMSDFDSTGSRSCTLRQGKRNKSHRSFSRHHKRYDGRSTQTCQRPSPLRRRSVQPSRRRSRSKSSHSEEECHGCRRPAAQRRADGERLRTRRQLTNRPADGLALLPERLRCAQHLQSQDLLHMHERLDDGWTEGSSEGEVVRRQTLRREIFPPATEYCSQETNNCAPQTASQKQDAFIYQPHRQQHEGHDGPQERGRSGFGLRLVASPSQQHITGETSASRPVLLLLSGGRLQPLVCGRQPGLSTGPLGVDSTNSQVPNLTCANQCSSATPVAATAKGNLHASATADLAAAAKGAAAATCGTPAARRSLVDTTVASAPPHGDGLQGRHRKGGLFGAADTSTSGRAFARALAAPAAAAVAADTAPSRLKTIRSGTVRDAKSLLPSPQFSDLSLSSGEVPPGCTPVLPARHDAAWPAIPAAVRASETATVADSTLSVAALLPAGNFASVSSAAEASAAAPDTAASLQQSAASVAAVPLASASLGVEGKSTAVPAGPSMTPCPAFSAPSDTLLFPSADTPPSPGDLTSPEEASADAVSPAAAECGNVFTFGCRIPSPVPRTFASCHSGSSASEAAPSKWQKRQLGSPTENGPQKPAPQERLPATAAAYVEAVVAATSDQFLRAAAAPRTLQHSTAVPDISLSEGKSAVTRYQAEQADNSRDAEEEVYNQLHEGNVECGAAAAARERLGAVRLFPRAGPAAFAAEPVNSLQKSIACGADGTKAASKALAAPKDKFTGVAEEQASAAENVLRKNVQKHRGHPEVDAEAEGHRPKRVQQQQQQSEFHLEQRQSRQQLPRLQQYCLQNPLKHHQQARLYEEDAGLSVASAECVVHPEPQPHCSTKLPIHHAAERHQPGVADERRAAVEETSGGPRIEKHSLHTESRFGLPCTNRMSTGSHQSRDDACSNSSNEGRRPSEDTKDHSSSNNVTCTGDGSDADDAAVDTLQDAGSSGTFLSGEERSSRSMCVQPAAAGETGHIPNERSNSDDVGKNGWCDATSPECHSPQTYHVAQLVCQQQQYLQQQRQLQLVLQKQPLYANHLQQQGQQRHVYLQQGYEKREQAQLQEWYQTWQQRPVQRNRDIRSFIRFPRRFRSSSLNRATGQTGVHSAELPALSRRNTDSPDTEACRLHRLRFWSMRREISGIIDESAGGENLEVRVTRRSSCPPPTVFQPGKTSSTFPPLPFFPLRRPAATGAAPRARADKVETACTDSTPTCPLISYSSATEAAMIAGQSQADSSVAPAVHTHPPTTTVGAPACDSPAFSATDTGATVSCCASMPVAPEANVSSDQKSPSRKNSAPATTGCDYTEATCAATASAVAAGDTAAATAESNTEGEWCMQFDMQGGPTIVDTDERRPSEEPENPVVQCTAAKCNPPAFSYHSSTTLCSTPPLPSYSACSSSAIPAEPSPAACANTLSASSSITPSVPSNNYAFSVLPAKSPQMQFANAARCTNTKSELLLRVSAHAQRLMHKAKQLRSRRMSS